MNRMVAYRVRHPVWCSPEWCDETCRSDIEHRSAPDTWRTEADTQVAVSISQDDEFDTPWQAGVRLYVEGLAFDTPGQDAWLRVDEAERLAAQLLAHASRARAAMDALVGAGVRQS